MVQMNIMPSVYWSHRVSSGVEVWLEWGLTGGDAGLGGDTVEVGKVAGVAARLVLLLLLLLLFLLLLLLLLLLMVW